jgi:hypothetical protein
MFIAWKFFYLLLSSEGAPPPAEGLSLLPGFAPLERNPFGVRFLARNISLRWSVPSIYDSRFTIYDG